jgi:hypothetical protein
MTVSQGIPYNASCKCLRDNDQWEVAWSTLVHSGTETLYEIMTNELSSLHPLCHLFIFFAGIFPSSGYIKTIIRVIGAPRPTIQVLDDRRGIFQSRVSRAQHRCQPSFVGCSLAETSMFHMPVRPSQRSFWKSFWLKDAKFSILQVNKSINMFQ